MHGHLCKNGMIRKCKAERCGFCRKKKKKEDSNVVMPSQEIDKFNAHIGTARGKSSRTVSRLLSNSRRCLMSFWTEYIQ